MTPKHIHKRKTDHMKSGFTLIELLVVVSIISLISSVVLVAIQRAREAAADIKYITMVKAMQQALEVYRAEKGYYPGQNSTSNFFVQYQSDDWTGVKFFFSGPWRDLVAELKPYLYGSIDQVSKNKTIYYQVTPSYAADNVWGLNDNKCLHLMRGSYALMYGPTAIQTVNQPIFKSNADEIDPVLFKEGQTFTTFGGNYNVLPCT